MLQDRRIMERVQKHYDYLTSLGLNVACIFAQGSMNYGLYVQDEDYKSDVDTKAIILPTLDDLIRGEKMKTTKYEFEGEQIDVKDIRVMVQMWAKANPTYLEILFTKYKIINPDFEEYINDILDMKNEIVAMNLSQLARSISGMSKEKVKGLEHLCPSQENDIEKFGYCPKQLCHIIRLNRLMIDIFYNHLPFDKALVFNDNNEIKKYLIEVKKGKESLDRARRLAIEYDNVTKGIMNDNLDIEFDSYTKSKLNDIVRNLVKFNIVKQIKEN